VIAEGKSSGEFETCGEFNLGEPKRAYYFKVKTLITAE
jgi:hypothetical protein